MAKPKLIPPDRERCQVESRTFMTFGPGTIRCGEAPSVIVRETKPQSDGMCGAMSMCAAHFENVFKKRYNTADYVVSPIRRAKPVSESGTSQKDGER